MVRVCLVQRRPLPNVILCIICATGVALASQQGEPPVRQGISETRAGYLVKAELRSGAVITFPAAPNQPMDVPHNAPIARNKGKTLLVLHFELRLTKCARLDREVLVIRENVARETQEGDVPEGKIYRYGGWWVENAKYTLCSRPAFAQPILGPWMNAFWDPISIVPETGQLQLIYEIDPASKKLIFTDGNVSLDVDSLLKRH
jgi:hypothetical protein